MKLLQLEAKRYRTLQDLSLQFSANYCTISGKNNAGKSSVIRLLSVLFRRSDHLPWAPAEARLDYKEDKTQWVKQPLPIEVKYALQLSKSDDPSLISFIEKMAGEPLTSDPVSLSVRYVIDESEELRVAVTVNGKLTDDKSAKEIDTKIRESDIVFLYNSTIRHEEFYYGRGRRRMFYDFVMSEDERKALDDAAKGIENRFRKLAREHRAGLNTMLGRLSEKYDVEFSQPEAYSTRHMPLSINLRDRHVEVPLSDWGSGTQNRTHILMAVLQANRIRTTAMPDDKITPILVIEEPESFLHPSAQSEFGSILRALSVEFGIQTIVTTHSPYMLNREEPAANILLCRRKGKSQQTCVVDTSSVNWMAPFAEHLGILPEEFEAWRPVFSAYKTRVLLVEGPIDKEYFEYFQQPLPGIDLLDKDIEVVPYGGKDALKNTMMVKFVLGKFDHVFVTYDLDAHNEVHNSLTRLGLKDTSDFLAVGLREAGRESIEGLLPERIVSVVNGRENALVFALRSHDSDERRKAKNKLKKKYLDEFKQHKDYTNEELKNLAKVIKVINHRLGQPDRPNPGRQRRRRT